jgi:cell division protein FtsQ
LTFALKKPKDYKIELILLEGNAHLSKEQYMQFANLTNKINYANLTLQIIKDRIEKHPYVENAEVRYDGGKKVSVRIIEKNFESILLKDSIQYILTDRLQALPFLPRTKRIDYPLISNAGIYDSVKVLSSLKKKYDVFTASKILSGIRLLNPELYDGLSTIDMRDGGDIILSFSFSDYPVVLGRGNEIGKIVYFNNLWTYLKGKQINNFMNYVDLRYSGHVYFGLSTDSLQMGDNKNSSLGEKS